MGKTQHIKPVFATDHELFKKTDDKGKVTYHYPHSDREICVLDEEFNTTLLCLLEPLEVIEKALCDSDNIPYANSITLVRQHISSTLYEIFRFIEQSIGTISISRIYENEISSFYRWGQCVDVKLLPSDISADDSKEGPIYDHNPKLIEHLKKISPDKTETIETILRILSRGDSISWQPVNNDTVRGNIAIV